MFDGEIELIIRIQFETRNANGNIDPSFLQGLVQRICVLLWGSMKSDIVIELRINEA